MAAALDLTPRTTPPTAPRTTPRTSEPAPAPPAARDLLALAARGLAESAHTLDSNQRYACAHLAALRAAAALLAARARPTGRHRVRSVWTLLPAVAPQLSEWAAFFAGGASKRAAAEAGIAHVVSDRDADDLLRDSERFVSIVADLLGLPLQPALGHDELR